jgi:hypothetical protein
LFHNSLNIIWLFLEPGMGSIGTAEAHLLRHFLPFFFLGVLALDLFDPGFGILPAAVTGPALHVLFDGGGQGLEPLFSFGFCGEAHAFGDLGAARCFLGFGGGGNFGFFLVVSGRFL